MSNYIGSQSAVKERTRLESVSGSLETSCNQLTTIHERLRNNLDRISGPVPESVEKNSGSATPSAVIGQIEGQAQTIDSLVNKIFSQITRLDTI